MRVHKKELRPVCATHLTLIDNMIGLMAMNPDVGSQVKLAAAAGLSQSTVSEMLSPTGTEPTLDRLESVATALGVPVWKLLRPHGKQ